MNEQKAVVKKSLNFNEGKPKPSLFLVDAQEAFDEMVAVFQDGIDSGYERCNWSWSMGTEDEPRFLEDNLDSILRHVKKYAKGTEYDEKSKRHHMAHAAVRCVFAIMYSKNKEKRLK